MLADRELWACANEVDRQHGSYTPIFIAERIGACALAGDQAGIATWKAIAQRYSRLAGLTDAGTAAN